MLGLGVRQTALDLTVLAIVAVTGKVFLPLASAGAQTPDKYLSALQAGGRAFKQAVAVGIQLAGIHAALLVGAEEIVYGNGVVVGIGNVHAVAHGSGHNAHHAVNGGICAVCGHDHACAVNMGHGDVAPPVHCGGTVGGIHHAHAADEHLGAVRQGEIHLIDDTAHALILIQAQDGSAVPAGDLCRKQRRAGQGRMTEDTAVPFNAAGTPCVAGGEICGTAYGICEQQILAGGLVYEAP